MARVLIIDDDSERIAQVRNALGGPRYDCRTTRATSRASNVLETTEPDLILLGLSAEEGRSSWLCDQLREATPFADLPLVLVGSADLESQALECMECGADDWLRLPLADCLIEARIRALTSTRRERERIAQADRELAQRREELGSTLDSLDESNFILEQTRKSERYLATHDRLTGIPNRQLFDDFADRALKFAIRYDQTVAILSLDLDHFERINESLSHSLGDQLLKSVAERVADCVRSSEMVARLGGDELIAMTLNMGAPGDAARVAEKMLQSVSQPHQIGGEELRITPSIGIAVYPDHGSTREELVKHAGMALRSVKADGGNNYRFFLPSMQTETPRRERLLADLHSALEHDEFVVYYQPQIDARKGELIGAEALVRWNHEELGMISPAEFIPLAEETGFIAQLGAWVLKSACLQKRAWEQSGLGAFPVSVNVSFRQLKAKSFAEVVVQILEETNLDPSHLDLEITENMIMDEVEIARETLTILSDIGVSVAIDDFGTGYSSLSVLGKFPAHTLKIDRAFVTDITTNSVKAAITRTIIAVANELNLRTIAEGVETEEQMEFLAELGCEAMQGYLFGKPVDSEEFAAEWADSTSDTKLK